MKNYSVIVQDAVKSYGNQEVLKKLCMRVEKGQIYGLLGSSGCGKTTLLSIIVGRKKTDSGQIWVLGGKPGEKGSGVPGLKVGYMPQETALVQEFTVKDAIFYFGRVFNMKEKLIEKRYWELLDLLNLPTDNKFIKECSGGQQRRVSFAVALVHKPHLLILDEPTVGIDPLLREKIWSYLVNITKEDKISVILTTHYIEECRRADKIGLMRDGRLLVEESPNLLLTRYNTDTLEEIYFLLSKQQEEGKLPNINSNDTVADFTGSSTLSTSTLAESSPEICASTEELTEWPKSSSNFINTKRMRALYDKNIKQFYRNIPGAFLVLGLPIISIIITIYTLGLDMKNIPIGIVNDEGMGAFCPNFSTNGTAKPEEIITDCHLENLSCRFLHHLDNHSMIRQVQYETLKEAYSGVTHGKINGLIYFSKNFSASFENMLNEGRETDEAVAQFGRIKVRLDMSNQQIGHSVKKELLNVYIDFQKSLFIDCKYLPRAATPPVQTEFIYGIEGEPYQVFILPGLIVTLIFVFGSMLTSTVMIVDRSEGIWDRSIVAGVTSTELTITHLSFQSVIIIVQTLEMIVIVYIIYSYDYYGSFWIMCLIVYIQGLSGVSYGYFISVITTNLTMSCSAVMGFFLPIVIISGVLWPLEGMPIALQVFSRSLPFTSSVIAFNNVINKGSSFSDFNVATGVLIPIVWLILFVSISLLFLKRQR